MISGLTLFPFEADWGSKVKLLSTFVTSVKLESVPGSMVRESLRDYGRRGLDFTVWLQGDVRRTWDAWREANPPGTVVGVPMWSDDGVELTSAVSSGGNTLTVSETANIDWRGELILVNVGDRSAAPVCEAARIDSISGLTINLVTTLSGSFPAGTKVMPLMRARQLKEFTENIEDEELSTAPVSFDEELATMAACSVSYTPPSFIGVPVFPFMVNEATASPATIGQGTHVVAAGQNAEAFATLRAYPRQTWSHIETFLERGTQGKLWKFFNDRRGRWNRFWLASLKNELKLSADIGSGDTTLALENLADFSTRFQLGAALRRAIFILNGNNFWIRRVLNLSGGTGRVSIDASLGAALAASQTKVAMLQLVHFAADDVTLEFDAPTIGDCHLSFEELEKEYAEVLATSGTLNGTVTDQGELIAA